MRKVLLTGVLGLSLLMGACTSMETAAGQEKTAINFYTASEKNNKDMLEIMGGEVTSEEFKMNLEFQDNMIKVAVTNTSDEVIVIDWEHARYTGLDGEEQKTFDMKQKDKGLYARQMATPLRPGQSYIAELVPVNNLHYTPGGSTGLGTIYIEKKLFAEEKAMQKQDFAKIVIPVTVGGVKKGKLQKYEVYFGEGDMPQSLGDVLYARNDSMAAAPVVEAMDTPEAGVESAPVAVQKTEAPLEITAPDAVKIKDENALLEQEIRSKNELIQELNERARLKKELEEKQKEIDALMLQLN